MGTCCRDAHPPPNSTTARVRSNVLTAVEARWCAESITVTITVSIPVSIPVASCPACHRVCPSPLRRRTLCATRTRCTSPLSMSQVSCMSHGLCRVEFVLVARWWWWGGESYARTTAQPLAVGLGLRCGGWVGGYVQQPNRCCTYPPKLDPTTTPNLHTKCTLLLSVTRELLGVAKPVLPRTTPTSSRAHLPSPRHLPLSPDTCCAPPLHVHTYTLKV